MVRGYVDCVGWLFSRVEVDGMGWKSLDEVNEKVYIADTNNKRVQVLSFQGEFLSHFGGEVLSEPWGISVRGDHIFVTNYGSHTLFQSSKNSHQLLNKAGGRGMNEGQLSSPLGLSVDWNGDVFVAERWNNRVSVFSNLLHYKHTIGHGSLSFPYDVKLTTDKVVVLDLSPNCIHFFSRSGDLLTSCVSQGYRQECLVCRPYFFCLDCEQNILVSDCYHDVIKILSTPGSYYKPLEGKGKEKENLRFHMVLPFLNLEFCLYCLRIPIILCNCFELTIVILFFVVICLRFCCLCIITQLIGIFNV